MLTCYFLFCAHCAYCARTIFAAMLVDMCFSKHTRKNCDVGALSVDFVRNLAITMWNSSMLKSKGWKITFLSKPMKQCARSLRSFTCHFECPHGHESSCWIYFCMASNVSKKHEINNDCLMLSTIIESFHARCDRIMTDVTQRKKAKQDFQNLFLNFWLSRFQGHRSDGTRVAVRWKHSLFTVHFK